MAYNFWPKISLLIYFVSFVYSQCHVGEVFHNNRCFRFENTPMAYEYARLWCETDEYYLASINNAFENSYIGTAAAANLNTSGNFWIGLEKWRDGNWHWSDDMPVNYLNWNSGEPNPKYFSAAYNPSTSKWVAVDNNTLLPFVCASWPNHIMTTPAAGASTPGKSCAGNLGYRKDMDACYEGMGGEGTTDGHHAEDVCSGYGHGCHLVSIRSQAENDYVNNIFGGMGYVWLGLVGGTSIANVTWTDGSPLNYTNFVADGKFRDYSCTSGDCCGVMIPNNWFLFGDNIGMWFLEDCKHDFSDYTIDALVCKSPYY